MDEMTTKDFIAALVLVGMYANPNHQYNTHYADVHEAFKLAEAFMAVRGDYNRG